MKILNNNNADYRTYEVEFFIHDNDRDYSNTEDIIIDISKDNYNDNDIYYSDLFNLIDCFLVFLNINFNWFCHFNRFINGVFYL